MLDARATVDYLYTRADIRTDQLAFMGYSMGGWIGVIVLSLEDRFRAGILITTGLFDGWKPYPEMDPLHFAPRVRVPILMINGKDDAVFPVATAQLPLFWTLGTPDKDKIHRVLEARHNVPWDKALGETSSWLDRYLGSASSGPDVSEVDPTVDTQIPSQDGNR